MRVARRCLRLGLCIHLAAEVVAAGCRDVAGVRILERQHVVANETFGLLDELDHRGIVAQVYGHRDSFGWTDGNFPRRRPSDRSAVHTLPGVATAVKADRMKSVPSGGAVADQRTGELEIP